MPIQNTADKFSVYFDQPGLTLTTSLSKAGGSFATVAPTITDAGNGYYIITPLAAHRDTLGVNSWLFDSGDEQRPFVETVSALDNVGSGGGVTLEELAAVFPFLSLDIPNPNISVDESTLAIVTRTGGIETGEILAETSFEVGDDTWGFTNFNTNFARTGTRSVRYGGNSQVRTFDFGPTGGIVEAWVRGGGDFRHAQIVIDGSQFINAYTSGNQTEFLRYEIEVPPGTHTVQITSFEDDGNTNWFLDDLRVIAGEFVNLSTDAIELTITSSSAGVIVPPTVTIGQGQRSAVFAVLGDADVIAAVTVSLGSFSSTGFVRVTENANDSPGSANPAGASVDVAALAVDLAGRLAGTTVRFEPAVFDSSTDAEALIVYRGDHYHRRPTRIVIEGDADLDDPDYRYILAAQMQTDPSVRLGFEMRIQRSGDGEDAEWFALFAPSSELTESLAAGTYTLQHKIKIGENQFETLPRESVLIVRPIDVPETVSVDPPAT